MKRLVICLMLFFSAKHDMLFAEGVFTRHLEGYLRSIAIDNNYIWCATDSGAIRFDKRTGEHIRYTKEDGLGTDALISVAIDLEGVVWFGHRDHKNSGVSWFDGSSWRSKIFPDSLHAEATLSIAVDRNNRKVFGASSSVLQFDGFEWSVLPGFGRAHAVFFDSDDTLWAAGMGRLGRYDGNVWEYFKFDSFYEYLSIAEDMNRNLWFGSDEGVKRYDGVNWKIYDYETGNEKFKKS